MLKYKSIRVPDKILVTDKNNFYYGKVLELFLEAPFKGSEELVFKIKNTGDDWYWEEDIRNLKYIDFEKVKDIKVFWYKEIVKLKMFYIFCLSKYVS
jgi:hypothetical protein